MQTKGVASVRSPVCNLQTHLPELTHTRFVDAVIRAFRAHYDVEVDEAVQYVSDTPETLAIPDIAKGMEEFPASV
jgi:lipoate---protein ligase